MDFETACALRNKLTSVIGWAQLAARRLSPEASDCLRRAIIETEACGWEMLATVKAQEEIEGQD